MEDYERAALRQIIVELTTLLCDDAERKELKKSQFRLIKGNFGQQKESTDLPVKEAIQTNIRGSLIQMEGK